MTVSNPTVRSRDGRIRVRTTERGLPVALDLDASELSRAPAELARDILALCQLSAKRAQVAHRRELTAQGYTTQAIRNLNLCGEEELAQAETALMGEDMDSQPPTWRTPR